MKPISMKRSTIYLIWVIPIIAIIISAIMLFQEYARIGESVVIVFKDARGFKVDETPVKYKGILIGKVKDIEVDPDDLTKFNITVRIKKSFAKYLTEGARFWKVSPRLKPSEFTGLSTIFSGTYIEFSPATYDPKKLAKLKAKRKFNGFEEEPKTNVTYFKLYSEDGSLIEGAPVLFKNYMVGNITRKVLKDKRVEYIISIDNRFASLVKVDSHFWKISPLDVKASFTDLKFTVNNAFNFFFGGIQFDSPDNSPSMCSFENNSKKLAICNKQGFYLFPSKGDTEYSLKNITLVLKNAHQIQSRLKLVYYKGDIAGKVVSSDYIVEKDIRYLKVRMKRKYENFLSYKSVFWIEKPGLKNLSVQSLLKGTRIEFTFYNRREKRRDTYTLYHSRPYFNVIRIKLFSDREIGLNRGDLIFYGGSIIGEIVSSKINTNGEVYTAIVYRDFAHLLKTDPVFYKKSGIEGEFSLNGVSVSVSPLKELLKGGVALLTGNKATSEITGKYKLFDTKKQGEEYLYLNGDGLKITLKCSDINGIYKGIPIFYRGLKIGKVYAIDFKDNAFLLSAFIEARYKPLVNADSLFFKSSGIDITVGLKGIDIHTQNILSMLKGAIILKNQPHFKHKAPLSLYKLYSREEYEEAFYEHAFLFADRTYGLKKGSKVFYKGIVVGRVKGFSLEDNRVKMTLLIDKKYTFLLTDKTRFYIEKMNLSAGEVKNISLEGSFIKIAYFNSKKRVNTFSLAGVNPCETVYREGLRVFVYGDKISSVSKGSPVLYKGVKIGEVEDVSLSDKFDGVRLRLFIEEKYRSLIKEDSEFKEIKPIDIKTGFIYAKLTVKPFSTIVKGGIELVSAGKGKGVNDGYSFVLKEREK